MFVEIAIPKILILFKSKITKKNWIQIACSRYWYRRTKYSAVKSHLAIDEVGKTYNQVGNMSFITMCVDDVMTSTSVYLAFVVFICQKKDKKPFKQSTVNEFFVEKTQILHILPHYSNEGKSVHTNKRCALQGNTEMQPKKETTTHIHTFQNSIWQTTTTSLCIP